MGKKDIEPDIIPYHMEYMRLSLVAKKINVVTSSIVQFLASNEIKCENNPNAKIDIHSILLIAKEFNAFLAFFTVETYLFYYKRYGFYTLDLSGFQLTTIPVKLLEVGSIRSLNIGRSKINDFSLLEYLTDLESLDISYGMLWDCSFLENLINLKSLNLRNNKISNCNFLEKLTNLRLLNLRHNKISNANPLVNLINLKLLDLSYNKISGCGFMRVMKDLTSIFLSNNEIRSLPLTDGLPSIEKIYLDNNYISDISPILSLIKKGITVDVSGRYLAKDKVIYVKNNSITSPPIEVIYQGNTAIINWFLRNKREAHVKLNEVRVILLGWGNAGKSSLLKRLLGESPKVGDSAATEGINLVRWELPNSNIIANIWDFGGQEMKHHTHQFFVSDDCIYIVVLDNRENEQAEYWLEYIRTVAGDSSPTLLVYNKVDESPNHHNTAEFQKKYLFIEEGTDTIISLPKYLKPEHHKYYDAFDTFKADLIRIIKNHRFIKTSEYSEHYIQVKKFIQENTEDKSYIKLSDYRDYCHKKTLIEKREQEDWLEILRKLGVVTYFGENYFNEDLLLLQPEWLTFAVYRIILHPNVKEKAGVIKLKDFHELLLQDDSHQEDFKRKYCYEEHDFEYIATMMEKYKICYRPQKDRNTLIIPTGFQSNYVSKYEQITEQCVNFEFSFKKFLPPSLFFSLVTELLAYDWIEARWETGIEIYDKENGLKALIKVDKFNRKITLQIWGKMPQSLLSIIRGIVKKLVRELSEVVWNEMDEMIPVPMKENSYIPYRKILNLSSKFKMYVQDDDGDDYKISSLLNIIETPTDTDRNMRDIIINNTNTNTNQNTVSLQNAPLEDLRDVLAELEDLASLNKEWQANFTKALKDLEDLENAQTKPAQNTSISRLRSFFNKAKDVKDWVAISVLPAELSIKIPKMLELGNKFLESLGLN